MLSQQSNRLLAIEGLDRLVHLEELYVSHNGIDHIDRLQENVSGRKDAASGFVFVPPLCVCVFFSVCVSVLLPVIGMAEPGISLNRTLVPGKVCLLITIYLLLLLFSFSAIISYMLHVTSFWFPVTVMEFVCVSRGLEKCDDGELIA